jgi:AraC family transcriptional regulator
MADPGVNDDAAKYFRVLSAVGGQELESVARGQDRTALAVALYAAPPYALGVPAMEIARVSIALTASPLLATVGSGKTRKLNAIKNGIFLIPPGVAVHWAKTLPSQHLNVYFRAEDFAGDDPDAPQLQADALQLNAKLPGIDKLTLELKAELLQSDALSAEAVDSLARLLLVRIARGHQGSTARTSPITPARIERLREFVMAHLNERVLVVDLARVLGLSVNRFAHVFSEQTGQSPHQFVLDLRLDHALELLRHSRLGLAEIAAACGFASQQHLSRTLRTRKGVTPAKYRDVESLKACKNAPGTATDPASGGYSNLCR